MGHTDPAALLEQMKKDHDGVLPKFDGEGHPLCPICETPCVAAGLTWSCPTHTEMCFALIDTPVSNEATAVAKEAVDDEMAQRSVRLVHETRNDPTKPLAQVAYDAYFVANRGNDGREMPPWTELPKHVSGAWEYVAEQMAGRSAQLGAAIDAAAVTLKVAGVEISPGDAADGQPFSVKAGVIVRTNTPEEGGGFSAWVGTVSTPEIHGVGTGATEAEAVLALAGLLGDFVRGHAKRIEELEFDRVPVLAVATAIPKIVCADCAWRHGVEMAKDSETGDAPAAPGKMVCSVCGLMFEGAFAIASPERVDVARASQPVTDFTRLVLARERVQAESLRLHFPEAR